MSEFSDNLPRGGISYLELFPLQGDYLKKRFPRRGIIA